MSKTYTKYDWASDRLAHERWADEEDRIMGAIDRSMRKRTRNERKWQRYESKNC